MKRRIAFALQKGGTGKTSVAVNLAAELAGRGLRVLFLDLDAQHNASDWLEQADNTDALYHAMVDGAALAAAVRPTGIAGLDCIPATPMLARIEAALAGRPTNPVDVLKPRLEELVGAWDYCLIDTPPSLGIVTVAALAAVNLVVAPAPPDAMSIAGLGQLAETVATVREHGNPGLRMRPVLNRYTSRTRHAVDVEAILRKQFGRDVFRSTIRQTVRMAEAWGLRRPIGEVAGRSKVADDFKRLARELERS